MQKVTFANGQNLEVEEVRGSYANVRETLVFVVPDNVADFDTLKTLLFDAEAAETITVEYQEQDENGEPVTQENVQEGYIVPISLNYEVIPENNYGRFLLILGKQTWQEKRIAELEEVVQMMPKRN